MRTARFIPIRDQSVMDQSLLYYIDISIVNLYYTAKCSTYEIINEPTGPEAASSRELL